MGPPHWQSPLQPEAMTAPQLHAVPTLEDSSRPLQQARWPGAPQGDAAAGGHRGRCIRSKRAGSSRARPRLPPDTIADFHIHRSSRAPSVCGSLLTVFRADMLPERAESGVGVKAWSSEIQGSGTRCTKPTSFAVLRELVHTPITAVPLRPAGAGRSPAARSEPGARSRAVYEAPERNVGIGKGGRVRRGVAGPCQRRISRIRADSVNFGPCGYALVVRGFVHSQPALKTGASAATNAETIGTLTGLRCVGVLAHCTDLAVAARTFNLDALL